jgi:hypothetical protein
MRDIDAIAKAIPMNSRRVTDSLKTKTPRIVKKRIVRIE